MSNADGSFCLVRQTYIDIIEFFFYRAFVTWCRNKKVSEGRYTQCDYFLAHVLGLPGYYVVIWYVTLYGVVVALPMTVGQ